MERTFSKVRRGNLRKLRVMMKELNDCGMQVIFKYSFIPYEENFKPVQRCAPLPLLVEKSFMMGIREGCRSETIFFLYPVQREKKVYVHH